MGGPVFSEVAARSRAGGSRLHRLVAVAGLAVLAAAAVVAAETGVPYFTNHDPRAARDGIGYQNWAITQDHRGVMYFGNTAGVVEYDGVDWRVIPVAGTARSLDVDAAGRIWVGAQGDVGYLEPGPLGEMRFRSVRDHIPPAEREFTDVWKTHAASDGVYFQTFSCLLRWDGRRMRVWRPEGRFHMSFLVDDVLYVREDGRGLLWVDRDELVATPWSDEFADDRVYAMMPAGDGRILVGTRERGLFMADDSRVEAFTTEADDYLQASQLYHGTLLADGSFALATLRGGAVLLAADGELLHILDRTLGIQDSTVTAVATDDRGGLWMALDRDLARVQIPASFTVFGEMTGLVGAVQSVLRHDGRLHVATTQGVYKLGPPRSTAQRPGTVNAFEPVTGVATQCWQLAVVEGELLVATNDGVHRIEGGRARRVAALRSLALEPSRRTPGRLYVGLLDGVAVVERTGGRWRVLGRVPEIDDEVRSLVEHDDGTLWVGGRYQGIARVVADGATPEEWRILDRWTEGAGLPLGVGRPRLAWVRDRPLVASNAGLLRPADDGDGLTVTADLGAALAAPDTWISQVREDAAGNVWLVTEQGVGVVRPGADGDWRWDDAPFRQLSPRGVWEIYPEPDGVAWFGTSDGLIRYDPEVSPPEPPAFAALVRSVRTLLNDRVVYHGATAGDGAGSSPTLDYERNSLRFEYAAPAPGVESAVEYQVRLAGFDPRWSGWTRENKREYTNLPEGRYTFHVRARLPGGVLSTEGRWAFTVAPPWYRTPWAMLGYAAGTVLVLFVTMRLLVMRARGLERRDAEDRRRRYELQQARRIQRNMLPSEAPEVAWVELAAVQHTATEVGGDYYDFFPQEDGRLYVAVGDATGHGLGAGLMVTATRTALLTIREPDLVKVADKVNTVLRRVNLGARLNMALTLVGLTPPGVDGAVRVEAAGGGMPPLYVLRRDGSVEEHVVAGLPLGALGDAAYGRRSLALDEGDTLVMMSDGVLEHTHPERGPLGYDGVLRALADFGRWYGERGTTVAAQEVLDFLLETCEGWSPRETIADDVTVVVMRIRPVRGASRGPFSRHDPVI